MAWYYDNELDERIAAIAKARINVKSLAYEARAIRKEAAKRHRALPELTFHRTTKLREEARCAQLALGVLRNMPYRRIERDAKTEPDWDRVGKKVSSFLSSRSLRVLMGERLQGYFKEFHQQGAMQ